MARDLMCQSRVSLCINAISLTRVDRSNLSSSLILQLAVGFPGGEGKTGGASATSTWKWRSEEVTDFHVLLGVLRGSGRMFCIYL